MTAIADRYSTLKTDIGDLLTSIQMTTTQSQDVAQAIRNLVSWLDSTELAISGQTPVSLRRSVLNSQIRASSALREDITNRQVRFGDSLSFSRDCQSLFLLICEMSLNCS